MTVPRPSLAGLLSFVFLMVVLGASAVVLFSKQANFFGWQILMVRSGSMEPAISTGSIVLVKAAPEYFPDDVVTFRHGGQVVTHRVVEKRVENWQSSFVTKGDANPGNDTDEVRRQDILGKVVLSVPLVGYFFAFLQTPLGVTLFVVIPGTILLYEHFKRIRTLWSQRKVVSGVAGVAAVLVLSLLPVQSTWAVYAATTHVESLVFSTTHWINPTAQFARDDEELLITIENAGGITRVEYIIEYDHEVEEETVSEHLEGSADKESAEESLDLPALTIGTCSADVCTPHEEVENMMITLKFMDGDEEVHVIEETFSFDEE